MTMASPLAEGTGDHAPAGHRIQLLPTPRRVRVFVDDVAVADTTRAVLLREGGPPPVYYFPHADLRADLMRASATRSHCPFKGEASYWTLAVGDRLIEDAAWSYRRPLDAVAAIAGHVAFYWDRVDRWVEEEDEIIGHPRDPFVRIDVLNGSRPARVVLGGETVAETQRPRILFETGLRPRTYIPPEDVRMDLLRPSDKRSVCPYKGVARYWSARIGDRWFENVVWSYPEPLAESGAIKGYLCFHDARGDGLSAGVAQPS